MIKRPNYCIKTILFCLVISFLSTTLYAFDTIKNMPSRNSYFIGRSSYLNAMQKILSRYGKVYLTGYGGIGKTQLAKEFSYIHEKKYDLIWWFDLSLDLNMQYESLLTHLNNTPRFKKLLHVDINNIAPSVLVEFTNSLLSASDCNWLLIFDNLSTMKDLKLPKTKAIGQHLIITTRKKQIFEKNVLTLESFTDKESELFLTKLHAQEKRENIVKLYRALGNYPLALAQVSEEILMHQKGIDSYLKKHDNFSMKSMPIHSDLTQEYNNDYHEVLNLTLQDIEQKDKEVAKILYTLVLLNIKLTKELLQDLFGDEIEKKINILCKYGVIQITAYESSQVLNIHDIIKEEAIKRLAGKGKAYKKEIVYTLVKHFENFYAKKDLLYLSRLDATNYNITSLYAFIYIALQNDIIDEGVIDAVILALQLNNILFNKNADPVLYQQLVNKISNKNMASIAPSKKALLYANLIICSSIFESEETIPKFEKEMLRLLNLIENKKNYKELFSIYTNISLFYLFLGDFKETKKYAKKAEEIINYAGDIFILLQYWYMYAWVYYETRDIDAGIKALDNYIQLSNNQPLSQVGSLFAKDLKVCLRTLIGQKEKALKEIEEAIKETLIYYNNQPSRILAELEYTKTLVYFRSGQYNLAEKQCHRAYSMLAKVLGSKDIIELPQAHIYVMLGKIEEEKGNHKLALEKYKKALEFYRKESLGRINNFYDYGELLSNLCILYYKHKNYPESKAYFKKLVTNFGLEHKLVEKLIKKLPVEYIYQVNGVEK